MIISSYTTVTTGVQGCLVSIKATQFLFEFEFMNPFLCTRILLFISQFFVPGMPTNPYLYANDLIDVLKKKNALGTYKSLVLLLVALFLLCTKDPSVVAFSNLLFTCDHLAGILPRSLRVWEHL